MTSVPCGAGKGATALHKLLVDNHLALDPDSARDAEADVYFPRGRSRSCELNADSGMTGLEVEMVDWSKCSDVDRDPDRISGQWAVKGTHIPVETVLDHAEAFTPEEMVDQLFPSLPLDRAKRIIAFARPKAHAHSP